MAQLFAFLQQLASKNCLLSLNSSILSIETVNHDYCSTNDLQHTFFLLILSKRMMPVPLIMPPTNFVCGGVYCFHVVRLAVCPSVHDTGFFLIP